jgi:hypothetical protein
MKRCGSDIWIKYPDYMTQGTSLDDLKEHLLDLYKDLCSGAIPNIRQHFELDLSKSAPQMAGNDR